MKSHVLPTEYRGQKYRSRTEARWAVFMDQMGVRYEYEKEGYRLDDFHYLPDFWLPDLKCFVEIKGEKPTTDEEAKASLLAQFTQKMVYIFCDTPQLPHTDKVYIESAYAFFPNGGADLQYWWCECRHCRKVEIQFNARGSYMSCSAMCDHVGKDYSDDTPRLRAAYDFAARYEFWSPKGGSK